MRLFIHAGVLALAIALAGCGDKAPPTLPPAATPAASPVPPSAPASAAAPMPDVGKLESVKTTAFGLGASAGEAMAEALKLALLQVNGATIETATLKTQYGLDVSLGRDAASLRAQEFVETVRQRSGGVIQRLQVLELQEPTEQARRFKVTIEAEIARFAQSADLKKIKVVIGQVRFDQPHLPMGDRSVQSDDVGATLRQRISDALVQTGRFAVLDREFSPDIAQELDLISSGQSPSAELAKLSQTASADIIWSGRISRMAYNRHARALKTSDRQLVSYSGGWALSQKLVNVASRQVMAAESLQGVAPSIEPTTLGSGVDGSKVLGDMSNDIVAQVVASVLQHLFPVTVVARDGTNVVLSQGGQVLKTGARYAMVAMGNEMKDPQTGQSLGRMEAPCCELVVDRVTPNLSYGHLENVRSNLDALPAGGLQMRAQLPSVTAATQAVAPLQAPAAATLAPPRRAAAPPVAAPEQPANKADDKW